MSSSYYFDVPYAQAYSYYDRMVVAPFGQQQRCNCGLGAQMQHKMMHGYPMRYGGHHHPRRVVLRRRRHILVPQSALGIRGGNLPINFGNVTGGNGGSLRSITTTTTIMPNIGNVIGSSIGISPSFAI